MQKNSAVSTSASVTIACDQAPMAPMATRESSVAAPMPRPETLPGEQREHQNGDRRRHAQQQLLEAAQDHVDRHADALEQRAEVQHQPVDALRDPGVERHPGFVERIEQAEVFRLRRGRR